MWCGEAWGIGGGVAEQLFGSSCLSPALRRAGPTIIDTIITAIINDHY